MAVMIKGVLPACLEEASKPIMSTATAVLPSRSVSSRKRDISDETRFAKHFSISVLGNRLHVLPNQMATEKVLDVVALRPIAKDASSHFFCM